MAILHRHIQENRNNGFGTNQAILDTTPYDPEVMIIGTFNPGTPNANFSDFFYGRNYFWPGFKNLFIHNKVQLNKRRMPPNGRPVNGTLDPTKQEIFDLCQRLKLCFTDLILRVLHKNNPVYQIKNNDNVVYNGKEYNLIRDGRVNDILGLEQLVRLNQVDWNTMNIIAFLQKTPSIKTIYLTRQPTGIWGREWKFIKTQPFMNGRPMTNIYTPSALGLPGQPRMNALLRHWIFNNDPNFGRLDNQWLVRHGVNLNSFK